MANVFGPALGIDAKGSVGKTITYQGRPKGTAAIMVPRHRDANSASQKTVRDHVADAIEAWRALSTADKLLWNEWVL